MQNSGKEQGTTPGGPDSLSDVFKKDQSQGPNQPRNEQGRKRNEDESEHSDRDQVPVGGHHDQQNPQLKSVK
jgi:hypothetical protein